MYEVLLTKKAQKELDKLAKIDSKKVVEKFLKLDYPFPKNFDIDKMSNEIDFYRLRSGKVRIIFEVDFTKKEIWIRKIKYRGSAYKI